MPPRLTGMEPPNGGLHLRR